mgnify:CR=1 FL=1
MDVIIVDKDKSLRGYLKYYASLIKDQYEWIDGLDNCNIDNSELEHHYDLLLEWVVSCYEKIQELGSDEP